MWYSGGYEYIILVRRADRRYGYRPSKGIDTHVVTHQGDSHEVSLFLPQPSLSV